MLTKQNIKFVRFGGLSPMKQEHFKTESDYYHNPPKRFGVFAFVHGYIETFLLGATYEPTNISNKSYWLKDDNGNKIKSKDFYYTVTIQDEYKIEYLSKINPKYINLLKKRNIKAKDLWNYGDYIVVLKKPKIFNYYGEIWHHLGEHLKPHQILESKGTWVKSSIDDYIYSFNQEIKSVLKQKHKMDIEYNIGFMGKQDPFDSSIGINFSKDHLEVFIEKI